MSYCWQHVSALAGSNTAYTVISSPAYTAVLAVFGLHSHMPYLCVQDTVDSVTGKGKAAAGGAYASAKDTVHSGAQYAQDAATTGKNKAQQAAGSASQYASDSANSAKDSANQFAGHATNKQGIFDKVKNAVTGQSNDAAAAGDQANYYARTGVDSAAQYAARANDKAGSAAGNAAQYAKDSVNQGKDAAGQFAKHASNTAQGKQGGIWNKVKNVVTGQSNDAANAGETAGEYVNSARNTAGQYAQDAKNQANHQSGKAGKYAQVKHCQYSCLWVNLLLLRNVQAEHTGAFSHSLPAKVACKHVWSDTWATAPNNCADSHAFPLN